MKGFVLLLLAAFISFAQPASAQTDAKAKSVLEAVSKKISSLKSLKASFALYNIKTKQSKKGTIYLKGPKYRISMGEQEIICDNKTVWTYIKAANEVQVSNYNADEATISPAKLFTNFYDKEYKYKYIGLKKVNGKNCDVVEMVPINKTKQFSKVELAFDHATNTLVGGNITEKNGNQFRYEVTGFTPNAAVTDALFAFDVKKYPKVEVVDLR
jgi:outer membrane lipoprotein carrier protein